MPPRPAILAAALFAACAAERPAPVEPTWVDDVQPILQANCFGCHGASFDSKAGRYRWDVYDLADPRYQEVGFAVLLENPDGDLTKAPVRTFTGARDVELYDFIKHYIKPDSDDLTRMPPPPATRLAARDVAVLLNWSTGPKAFQPGSHSPNHPPTIDWVEPGRVFAVRDEDGDQVLGKLDCSGSQVLLPRTGSHELPPGVLLPCTGKLFDGWDAVTPIELK